jgi:hypothetical protein
MWITIAWQCISPELIVKGFMQCCISSAMDGNDIEMKRMGMLGECARKMKALTVKMETVTPIGRV